MREALEGAPAAGHAAARKALKHLSKALRTQLKVCVWRQLRRAGCHLQKGGLDDISQSSLHAFASKAAAHDHQQNISLQICWMSDTNNCDGNIKNKQHKCLKPDQWLLTLQLAIAGVG